MAGSYRFITARLRPRMGAAVERGSKLEGGLDQRGLEAFLERARGLGSPTAEQLRSLLPPGCSMSGEQIRHLFQNFGDAKVILGDDRYGRINVSRREVDIFNYFVAEGKDFRDCFQLMPYRNIMSVSKLYKFFRKQRFIKKSGYRDHIVERVGAILSCEAKEDDGGTPDRGDSGEGDERGEGTGNNDADSSSRLTEIRNNFKMQCPVPGTDSSVVTDECSDSGNDKSFQQDHPMSGQTKSDLDKTASGGGNCQSKEREGAEMHQHNGNKANKNDSKMAEEDNSRKMLESSSHQEGAGSGSIHVHRKSDQTEPVEEKDEEIIQSKGTPSALKPPEKISEVGNANIAEMGTAAAKDGACKGKGTNGSIDRSKFDEAVAAPAHSAARCNAPSRTDDLPPPKPGDDGWGDERARGSAPTTGEGVTKGEDGTAPPHAERDGTGEEEITASSERRSGIDASPAGTESHRDPAPTSSEGPLENVGLNSAHNGDKEKLLPGPTDDESMGMTNEVMRDPSWAVPVSSEIERKRGNLGEELEGPRKRARLPQQAPNIKPNSQSC